MKKYLFKVKNFVKKRVFKEVDSDGNIFFIGQPNLTNPLIESILSDSPFREEYIQLNFFEEFHDWFHIFNRHLSRGNNNNKTFDPGQVAKELFKKHVLGNKKSIFNIPSTSIGQRFQGLGSTINTLFSGATIIIAIENPFTAFAAIAKEQKSSEEVFALRWKQEIYQFSNLINTVDNSVLIYVKNPVYSSRSTRVEPQMGDAYFLVPKQGFPQKDIWEPYRMKEYDLSEIAKNYTILEPLVETKTTTKKGGIYDFMQEMRFKNITEICGFEMRLLRFLTTAMKEDYEERKVELAYYNPY